ncbi:MAG TPA: AraC family transcriptional regulator [Blastocatellia bacterium]|nr:AraC family transcriptional regulator [Blastocatellia bacterium]
MGIQPVGSVVGSTYNTSPQLFRSIESGIRVRLMSDPAGVVEVPAMRSTVVSIHIGPSVHISCRRGGENHRGTAVHGDIDIIPSGVPSRWEMKATDNILGLMVSPSLLRTVAEELEIDPSHVDIRNEFQIRDPQLENIAWAIKSEMEYGFPCGRVYIEGLALSVAARLLRFHSSVEVDRGRYDGRFSDRRLREVLSFIEDNMNQDVSLTAIAQVAGISVSHLKTLFRESMGVPVHQYLIRRRLERAKTLIGEGKLSINQIALETGFTHQSHLARHMKRVLGVSPKTLRKMLAELPVTSVERSDW